MILLGLVVVGIPLACVVFRHSRVPRILGALALVALALFSAFGILASVELPPAARLPWQLGYGFLALASMAGAVVLWRART